MWEYVAIAGAIGGAALILSGKFQELWEKAQTIELEKFQLQQFTQLRMFDAIKEGLSNFGVQLGAGIGALGGGISQVGAGIQSGLDALSGGLTQIGAGLQAGLSSFGEKLKTGIESTAEKLKAGVENTADKLKAGVESTAEKLKAGLENTADKISSGIQKTVTTITEKLPGEEDWQKVVGAITSGVGTAQKALSKGYELAQQFTPTAVGRGALQTLVDIVGQPVNFLFWVGQNIGNTLLRQPTVSYDFQAPSKFLKLR